MSERDLEDRRRDLFLDTEGIVLVSYSSQNIDWLVTLYRAARQAGRRLVLDLYTATIAAAATGRETIPQAHWDGIRVYVPQAQRARVKRSREFERVTAIRDRRIYLGDLAARGAELVLTFRGAMTCELERADCLAGGQAIWSLWPCYLDRPSGEALKRWVVKQRIPLTILHSSGHATVADLKRLGRAVNPGRIVGIRTAAPERYGEIYERVELHPDREGWSV